MRKSLSLIIAGLISLIFFEISSAATNPQNITNITNIITYKSSENLCTHKIFITDTLSQYPDYINMRIDLNKKIFLQEADPGLAIVCFENPYTKEIAGNVVTITNPVVQKDTSNLASSELFLNLNNNGNENHALIAVKSAAAQQIQLQTIIKERSGVLNMKLVKQIPLKVNQDLALTNVGYHIMLIDFNPRLRAMDKVPLTLFFEDGSKINLNAQVRCENFYQ